jgi:hypothetical protein
MDQIDEMVEQALVDIGQLDEGGADARQAWEDAQGGPDPDQDDDGAAYDAYVAECEAENLEAHPWAMWVLHGKPKSIWAAL